MLKPNERQGYAGDIQEEKSGRMNAHALQVGRHHKKDNTQAHYVSTEFRADVKSMDVTITIKQNVKVLIYIVSTKGRGPGELR